MRIRKQGYCHVSAQSGALNESNEAVNHDENAMLETHSYRIRRNLVKYADPGVRND
jgi:hypothetical protein